MDEDLKLKFDALMYAMTKQAAQFSFANFLAHHGVTDAEWKAIRKHLAETYGVKTYC